MPHAEAPHHVADFAAFVQASPSSYHAAAEVARLLAEAGWAEQDEEAAWDAAPGGHYLVRDGAVMAWWVPTGAGPESAYRIVGSHTDSPGFKVKPDATYGAAGWQQVGVEIYGGPLLASWTDRELGIAGRVVTPKGEHVLVHTDAIMRIPQLAIHLNRSVNEEGLKLDKQAHTAPIFSVRRPDLRLLDVVMSSVETDDGEELTADDVGGHDLFAFDTARPKLFGADDEFLACTRVDNLSSVHASVIALLNTDDTDGNIAVLAAFDHEEVGSNSRSGACGPLLQDVLLRVWKNRETLEISTTYKAYLYRAAMNMALDHLQKHKRQVAWDDARVPEPSRNATTEHLDREEAELAVAGALEALPPQCRAVFVMSREEGMSYRQIAEALNVAPKTVENQMGKALRLMRERLSGFMSGMSMCVALVFENIF